MKIVHVQNCLALGGADILVIELATQQLALGHDVAICTLGGDGPLDAAARANGLRVDHLDAGRSLLRQVRALYSYFKSTQPDAVNSHWRAWLPTALATAARRIPYVHTHHGNSSRREALKDRVGALLTDKVVSLAPETDRYLTVYAGVPQSKIVLIPNGVNLERFAASPRAEIEGIPEEAPVAGMVARLFPPKDYSTLLRAAKLLNQRMPGLHFVAVGDGAKRLELEEEMRTLGVVNFRFLGARQDVPAILRRLDVFVLSTRHEGHSLSLIEAMAAGCLPIASDIPPNRYSLEDGRSGILFETGNPAALAEAILRGLTDESLRALLVQASRERCAYFSSRRMATDYLALYASILARSAR